MLNCKDPLGNNIILHKSILYGHIYRRHPELRKKLSAIKETIINPDFIAKSKKDEKSLLYFKRHNQMLFLMVVGTPRGNEITVRTSFYVFNTSKGDPIIWRKKIST